MLSSTLCFTFYEQRSLKYFNLLDDFDHTELQNITLVMVLG